MANVQLKTEVSEPAEKKKGDGHSDTRIPDSYVENMTAEDMIAEFPKLVRGGQYVNALAVIQGHGRCKWFYSLLEKVGRYLFCKQQKEKPAAEKENDAVLPVLKKAKAE